MSRSAPPSKPASPARAPACSTMKWDLLCTNCRGAKLERRRAERAAARRALPVLQHRLRPRLREERRALLRARARRCGRCSAGGFCLSGPMATPHVAVQLLLAPGEKRTVPVDLPPGSYRLRTLHPGAFVDVDHARRRLSRPAHHRDRRRGPAARRRGGRSGRHHLRQRRGLRARRPDRGPHLDARGADRAGGDLAAGLPRPLRRRDACGPATRRASARWRCCSPTCRARRRSTSGWAMPRPSTWCASTSPCWPRSCATMTARWSRPSATPSWPRSAIPPMR